MARGSTKPRDLDFSNVGTQGRRTGLTMEERERDEYGMEEVDGLFSSPEKSPARLNGFSHADDDSAGSEMSIEDGKFPTENNAPGPMDFLSASNNARIPFAASRSPAKARRRSPVLRSSPDDREDLVASSPSDGRRLSSARGDPTPLTNRSVNAGVTNKNAAQQNGKARLAATEAADFSDGEGEGDENVDSFAAGRDNYSDGYDEGDETVMPEELADATIQDANGQEEEESPAPAVSRQTKTAASSSKPPKKGAAAKTTKTTKPAAKSTGKRGRAPKSQQAADNEEPVEARPAKKPKTTAATSQVPREPLDPELERVVENYAQRTGPLKGRSLYILKREDPTSSETTHTRSGRVSVRPLAYWRNERCVYGDEEAAEGERFPLSKIKEVIRTEELEPERSKKGKRSRKGKSKKQKDESSDEDEIDDDADLWEKETGVLHGYVSKWDPVTQTSTAEEEVIDIAYAPSGFETREVKGASFKFAKLLSSSFIGSGVVELPPDGVKKPKNSKRMHMVFYVCYGRVQVDICGVQFSAGKGSVFQIPRGNYYSFQNSHKKDARLFFTQCCLPEGSEVPVQTQPENAVQSEFEAESGPSEPPAAKARGRPKGKQKAK
ncbi:Centromere protein 3 [Penicillium rolfsii]|nr:Centromere protein 3 [Penicillium rolfsii]